MKAFWYVPVERSLNSNAASALLDVSALAARHGVNRIAMPYKRVDDARNSASRIFWHHSDSDEDVLVMLDCDHVHPSHIVPHLVARCDAEHEVVAALAFRRSLPHDPCMYHVDASGATHSIPTSFTGEMMQCDIVGTGAIAIRRSAFRKLSENGYQWPWFRFSYKDGFENEVQNSEDWNFGLACMKTGISHWCDSSIVTPHIDEYLVTPQSWFDVLMEGAKDPEAFSRKYEKLGMTLSVGEQAQ